MADAKLSALTELTVGPADADEIYIRDESVAASDESKRITAANLLNPENLTELAATPASTDELAINDGGVGKKITVANLLAFYDAVTATLTNKTFDANGTGNSITNIENADIAAAAAIAFSKLATLTDGNILVGNASNVVVSVNPSGDIDVSNAGVFSISSDVVVNADVKSDAAIAYSKLAALTDGNILVGNGSNVAVSVNPSGDVDISNAGVFSIAAGVIVDADVSGTAEIAVSKLADGTARQLLQTDSGGTAVEWASNIDIPGTLDVTGATTLDSTLAVAGDLAAAAAVIVGHTVPLAMAELTSEAQVIGTAAADGSLVVFATNTTDTISPSINLVKSGHGTVGSFTTVANNELLGSLRAYGDDGTDYDTLVAEIQFNVDDGSVAAGQIGGEMLLRTATSGGTMTTRLRIRSTGVSEFVGTFQSDIDTGPRLRDEAASPTNPTLIPDQSDDNTGIGLAASDELSLIAGGHEMLRLEEQTSVSVLVSALFDAPDVTLTDGASARYRAISGQDLTVTLGGTTQVTTLNQGMALDVAGITLAQSGGAVTVNEISAVRVPLVIASTSVTATDSIGVDIDEAASAGTVTTQHGVRIGTLAEGATNYLLTLGNTDVDHNLIHVGVTGDPILSWDESESLFSMNLGLILPSLTTLSGDLTINPAASLNVTLTDDDADSFDLANSAASYYLIDTRNTASGTNAHTFDTEDVTLASAAGASYNLALFPSFTINYTGSTQVTGLQITTQFNSTALVGGSAITVDQATNVALIAPSEGANVTLTDTSAILIDSTTGTPVNQHGIRIQTLSAGATANYAITVGNTDVDHSLMHVGVTGDPVLGWDESQDQFTANKGLDVTAGTITFDEVDDGNSGAADTIDWGAGQKHKSTLTDNVTYTFTDPAGPCNLILRVVQDAGGGNTVTWPASAQWPGGTAPTISTGGDAVDIISFYFDGTNYHGNFSQNFS